MARNRTVLILEDDIDLTSIFQYVLEEESYRVIVSQPCKYRKDISEFQPGIILLDHWLCLSCGKNIFKELKGDNETSSIPLILTTTFKDLFTLGKSCIPDDVLHKPFDIEVLVRKVNRLMDAQEEPSKIPVKPPRNRQVRERIQPANKTTH